MNGTTLENYTGPNLFGRLPEELSDCIRGYLSKDEQRFFSHAGRTVYNKQHLVLRLLDCIASGNQDKAQRLLTLHPDLAAKKGIFTDWSGRTFNCSPFEYALWALDVCYMCPMMLDCLPKDEKGEKIRIVLLEQAQMVQTQGLSYKLNGILHQEKHFDFGPLKLALRTYIDNFKRWKFSACKLYWCGTVGKEQLLLPAHIRQHYCDPEESFYPTPTFNKERLERSLTFYPVIKDDSSIFVWNEKVQGLGSDFAIARAKTAQKISMPSGNDVLPDLKAIIALEKVRIENNLPQLYKRLETPLQEAVCSSTI